MGIARWKFKKVCVYSTESIVKTKVIIYIGLYKWQRSANSFNGIRLVLALGNIIGGE